MDGRQICCTCKLDKPLEQFSLSKQRPSGRHRQCKQCNKAYKVEYRKRPEVIQAEREYSAIYVTTEESKRKTAEYRKRPDVRAVKRERNKSLSYQEKRKEYLARPEVKERVLELRRKRYAARWKLDAAFQIDARFRVLIRRSIKTGKNSMSWRSLVEFSIEEFKDHFERQFTDGMSWDEFLAGNIHIDHIVPVSSFDIKSVDCQEFKSCWNLSNLRPMWAKDNNLKRANRIFLL